MRPDSAARAAVLVAAVSALCVASAGCIVQDRPEHAEFHIVADAGEVQVVPVGATASFEWPEDHAIEAEGEHPPEVHLEYAWHADGEADPISTAHSASISRASPGLAVVGLEVAAEGASASDATGVLFVPADADPGRGVFVAVIGDASIAAPGPGAGAVHEVEFEGVPAQWVELSLPTSGPDVVVDIAFDDIAAALDLEVEATIVVAVKRGAGPAHEASTGPANFSAGAKTSIRVSPLDVPPMIDVDEPGATHTESSTLPDYGTAHRAEGEVSVLVSESQTLPGFDGAAAVASVLAVAGLAVAARRRR